MLVEARIACCAHIHGTPYWSASWLHSKLCDNRCCLLSPASLARAAQPSAGPRSWTFSEGERKAAFQAMMDASDVVCMTEEEAEAVTGVTGAEAQARWVLGRPGARTEWCVIKRGAEGAVLASRSCGADAPLYRQQALRVDVRDTGGVGWGGGGVMWVCGGVGVGEGGRGQGLLYRWTESMAARAASLSTQLLAGKAAKAGNAEAGQA